MVRSLADRTFQLTGEDGEGRGVTGDGGPGDAARPEARCFSPLGGVFGGAAAAGPAGAAPGSLDRRGLVTAGSAPEAFGFDLS